MVGGRNRKGIISLLICIVLVVSFSSCGGVVKNADVKDDVDSSCGDVSLNPNSTYEGLEWGENSCGNVRSAAVSSKK